MKLYMNTAPIKPCRFSVTCQLDSAQLHLDDHVHNCVQP